MVDAIKTALSGLTVQKLRVSTAAVNIANVNTGTPLSAGGQPESSPVYKPLTVQVSTMPGGSVAGTVVETDAAGVDLATEAVTVMDAKNGFKANLAVIKTQDEMTRDLLDILA